LVQYGLAQLASFGQHGFFLGLIQHILVSRPAGFRQTGEHYSTGGREKQIRLPHGSWSCWW
jgi:hypothetical protein